MESERCKRGHVLSEDNRYKNSRRCKKCQRLKARYSNAKREYYSSGVTAARKNVLAATMNSIALEELNLETSEQRRLAEQVQ